MRCKQHPNCAFLQYLRHITSNCPSSHAPPDGLCSASRPAVLSLPVSRKLLGGRANKQDKQHSHRATPTRHRRLDRLDSLRRVHRRNSRLYRGNPGLHRTRTLRRRPHPQYYTSSHILRRRDRGTIFGFFFALTYGISSGLGASVVGLFGIVFLIGGAIFGLSEVLLTYSLQSSNRHMLLWGAYGISIFLGVVNVFLLPFGSGGFWTLYFGTGVLLFTGFLAAIPAALYGTAFYLARERIVRHEIPPPMTQQQPGKPPW